MFNITIDLGEARKVIKQATGSSKNFTETYRRIAPIWKSFIDDTFLDQRDPWGNSWAPLKDSTLKLRRRKGYGGSDALVVSGTLQRSPEISVYKDSLTFTLDGLAAIHQVGNPRNRMVGKWRAPIPARPMIPVRKGGAVELPDSWRQVAYENMIAMLEGRQ